MKAHVETLVIDPDRVPKPRYPFDALPVAGNGIQRRLGEFGEAVDIEAPVLERQRPRVEKERCAHVHGSSLALYVEEGRVEGAQSLIECVGHTKVITSKIRAQRGWGQ